MGESTPHCLTPLPTENLVEFWSPPPPHLICKVWFVYMLINTLRTKGGFFFSVTIKTVYNISLYQKPLMHEVVQHINITRLKVVVRYCF